MERVDAAQRLLLALHDRIGVTGAVCGGYVRDTLLSKPIRDIDLYVPNSSFKIVKEHVFGAQIVANEIFDEDSDEYKHQSIEGHCEADVSAEFAEALGLPVRTIDIVAVRDDVAVDARSVIERYNLGISKAGIDINGLVVSPDLRADADDQMITLLRTDWGYEGSMKKFIALQTKYPWPLRVRKQEDVF